MFSFVHVFASLVAAGLGGWALFFMLRPRTETGKPKQGADSSTAVIAAVGFIAAVLGLGIVSGGYVAVLLAGLAACAAFVPRVPRRTWMAGGIIGAAVWLAYVTVPLDNFYGKPEMQEARSITSSVTNCFAYDDKDLLTGNDFLVEWMGGAPTLDHKYRNHIGDAMTLDFAKLAQKAAGAPGLSAINYFRPVIALSYMADTFFWGQVEPWEEFSKKKNKSRVDLKWTHLNSIGFHLTNILAHALNSILVFVLVRSLTRQYWFSLVAALVFAVHPIHTESVSWIAGRTDVMGMTFYLFAFWLYVRFRNGGHWGNFVAACALYVVGTFAKEMIAGLPFILALYEMLRLVGERRRERSDLWYPVTQPAARKEKRGLQPTEQGVAVDYVLRVVWVLPFFALLAFYFAAKSAAGASGPTIPQADTWYDREIGDIVPVTKRFFSFMSAIFWYLQKALLPSKLNIYPSVDFVESAGKGLLLALVHTVVVGGLAVVAWLWRRGRMLALAGIGFYLSLGPLSCILPNARLLRFAEDVDFPVSERFLYFPSLFVAVGAAWVIAVGLPTLNKAIGRVLGLALLVVIVGWSVFLIQKRNIDWYDDFRLFQSGVKTSPKSVRMANNCGFELMQNWEIRKARRMLTRCTELVRKVYRGRAPMPVAFQNLGHSYYLQGEFDSAVRYYRQSFAQDPRNAVAANNLGALMGIFGSITMNIDLVSEGLKYYRESVRLAPGYVFARTSVGFMQRVEQTWRRYLFQNNRSPLVVASFANSFLFSAKSISQSDDPKYLQAMQILDSGLRHLPSDDELAEIFGANGERLNIPEGPDGPPHEVKKHMSALFDRCATGAIDKFDRLLEKYGADNPALNFMLGQVYRVRWRKSRAAADRDAALERYKTTLAKEPDHVGATIGSVELLRSLGRTDEALAIANATVDEMLREELPWDGAPVVPPRGDPRGAIQIATRMRDELKVGIKFGWAKDSEQEKKAWEAFVASTVAKCLDYQRSQAERSEGGNDPEAWNNLGYFYLLQYKITKDKSLITDLAIPLFDKALAMDRTRPGPALNKIHALKQLGRNRDAEALRRQMAQIHRYDPRFQPPGGHPTRPAAPGTQPLIGPNPNQPPGPGQTPMGPVRR